MKYILINLILEGQFKDNLDGTGTQKISVVTGIDGDTHGFVKTDTFDVPLTTSTSIDADKAILNQAALDFIAANYPNN